jgi:hypothetical protein
MQRPRGVTKRGAGGLALVSLTLGAAFATACSRSEDGRATPPQKSADAIARPSVPVVELDGLTRGWAAGKRYGYRIKLSTELSVAGGPKSFDFDLVGNAAVVPVSVNPTTATLYVSIGDAAIVSRIPQSQSELDKVSAEIRTAGVFFTMSGGRTSEMRFPPGQSPMASSSYRTIASALQFARAKTEAKHYASEEYDSTGLYLAEYEQGANGSEWSKKKQRYLAILGTPSAIANQPIPVLPEVTSAGTVRLSQDGRPELVKLRDRVIVNGSQMPVSSTVVVELEAGAEPPALAREPDWSSLLATFQSVPASQPIGVTASVEQLDEARIGQLDFETILSRLEELGKDRQREKETAATAEAEDTYVDDEERAEREEQLREDSKLFFALSAIFRQQPKAVTQAARAIRGKSPASETLMDALSSASSADAQRALVALMNDKNVDENLRSRAINALVRTPKPNDASIAAIKARLAREPFDEQALFGLGTYSRLLRDSGKAKEARALGDILVLRLKQAKIDMDVVTVLRSIANSGHADALPRVLPYLSDDREKVRAAAVRALQSMRGPQVDGILAAQLKKDPSSKVRIAAVAAAQVREPSAELAGALVAASTEATDARVRFRAIELMVRWLPKRPELRAALERVATNDTEPKVRNRAKAAL